MSGVVLPARAGERIVGGAIDATLKAAMGGAVGTSSFEMVVPAGYDVGAHRHREGEEVFFVLDGELDLLAFEPVDRSLPDWHEWVSGSGQRYLRGGPGAFMHVPVGVPHAFSNPSHHAVRMFFQSSAPGGHENYFRELAEMLRTGGPDEARISALRERYDIEPITALRGGTPS